MDNTCALVDNKRINQNDALPRESERINDKSSPAIEVRTLDDIDVSSTLARQWDQLVCETPESGIMQTIAWSEFKRRQGLNRLHLGLFSEDRLTGGAILYSAGRSNGAGVLCVPEGPVLNWQNEAQAAAGLRLIMDAANDYALSSGAMVLRIEPRLVPPQPRILREFGKAPVNFIPKETLYIDLAGSEEQIMAAMQPKGRYNIRVAQRHGVRVIESTNPSDVVRFYRVVEEASRRDDFALEPLQFFRDLVETLCPAGHARMLFAEHEGDVLGALLLVTCGTRATYLYGGIANTKRNLMGGYALQWAAMATAKRAGCTIYDMYGFDGFMAPGNAYARFSQFKRRFGGQVVRFIGGQEHFFTECLANAFIKAVSETGLCQGLSALNSGRQP
jgi:peptidoglycan pentaglycine glycine transferase (the first glycine)